MKIKKIVRHYSLKDSELSITTASKISFIRRDMEQFNRYGITENDMIALENKTSALVNLPTDIEIKETQNSKTLEKKEKAVALIEAIEDVMAIVGRKFKKNTAHYHAFGTKDLTKQSDAILYVTARLVVKNGIKYFDDLSSFGLSTTILNNLETLTEAYLDKLVDQQIGSVDREYYREIRVLLGNEIYTTLSSYMAVGKSIWETKSAAKTNDYYIYKGKKKSKTA